MVESVEGRDWGGEGHATKSILQSSNFLQKSRGGHAEAFAHISNRLSSENWGSCRNAFSDDLILGNAPTNC